jgi:hypothetical protein
MGSEKVRLKNYSHTCMLNHVTDEIVRIIRLNLYKQMFVVVVSIGTTPRYRRRIHSMAERALECI